MDFTNTVAATLDESTPSRAASALPVLDQLRATGYAILECLVPQQTIDQINLELQPWLEATTRCEGDFYGWLTTRVNSVLFKAPSSHALALHPRILALMDDVLGPHCDWYQLNLSQVIRMHSGERQQIPHRDDEMWPCAKGRFEYMANVMWALTDFTAANGATMLWPRSQHGVVTREADVSHAVTAQMPRGSALIYLGSVTHCGGGNTSLAPRDGLVFSYCLGWLKPYENPFLAYPPEIAKTFPKPIRDLLGYRIHRPNLGHYEGQDPAMALETDSRTLPMVDALPAEIAAQLRNFHARR